MAATKMLAMPRLVASSQMRCWGNQLRTAGEVFKAVNVEEVVSSYPTELNQQFCTLRGSDRFGFLKVRGSEALDGLGPAAMGTTEVI